jgi:hypothetical protein
MLAFPHTTKGERLAAAAVTAVFFRKLRRTIRGFFYLVFIFIGGRESNADTLIVPKMLKFTRKKRGIGAKKTGNVCLKDIFPILSFPAFAL